MKDTYIKEKIYCLNLLILLGIGILPTSLYAHTQFVPTSGALVTGTETSITSVTTTGNVGSYYGTLSDEAGAGFSWTVNSDITNGLDQQIILDDVSLFNANKFIVTIVANAGSASLNRLYQICDWVSTTGVDNATDTNCTGGGWRTLNKTNGTTRAAIAETTQRTYVWHVYDGYWTTLPTGNTAISTPLSNFIRSTNNRVLLRAYSNTGLATTHLIDFAQVSPVIDPVYSPAGFSQLSGGTVTTSYLNVENPSTLVSGNAAATGSDNVYLSVPGTVGSIADFYLSFRDVRTYAGMNTIVVNAEYSCSAIGINHRPKIYNFTTSSWEDLTSTSIACAVADITSQFAKNNITISDYISGGEVRIGWYGLSNGTQALRLDTIHIVLGSTNTNIGQCEISFGTGTVANCSNTRDLDTTLGSPSIWSITSELESATMSHPYYGFDNDGDAVSGESALAGNVSIPITLPDNAYVIGYGYALRIRSGSATRTITAQLKDYNNINNTTGGWTALGTSSTSATVYSYSDPITSGYMTTSPEMHIDTENNLTNVRVRTSASTDLATTAGDVDFVMTSIRWVEYPSQRRALQSSFTPSGGLLVVGTEASITSAAATGNVGSYYGVLSDEAVAGFNWTVNTDATNGLDQQIYFDNADLHNANLARITIVANAGSASLNRLYQICDWVSTTGVDNAADTNCTGGGWRTLNKTNGTTARAAIAETTQRTYVWRVYDGYWTTSIGSNVPVSTPLVNFIRPTNKRVLIRAYSNTALATTHLIDFANIQFLIDPIYSPAALTATSGLVTTTHLNAENPTTLVSGTGGTTGSDNFYASVSGSLASAADFYFSFKNIRTYAGTNTIVVNAEYSCSASGINHRPKIYNFTTSSWEDLTSTSIACAVADTTSQFAKSNITISDYISNGEIRVGWYGLSVGTQVINIDTIYIILGSTNTNTGQCEISFGTGTVANCSNTRDLDTTLGSPSIWSITSELESATMSHPYYGFDNDRDAVSSEAGLSANLSSTMILPSNGFAVGVGNVIRYRSGSATRTISSQIRDYNSSLNVTGGWLALGTTSVSAAAYTYTDPISSNFVGTSQENYIDTENNLMNNRIRTSTSTDLANSVTDIDFVMSTMRWVENTTKSVTITESGGSTNITEAGATDSYSVVLTSQPVANVTVTIASDAQSTTNVPSLVFTTSNWSTPQTVTVTAVNDLMMEGAHTGSINHTTSSSDADYNSITVPSILTQITDNDIASVTITESGGTTNTTEGGTTDTYSVVLTSQPVTNVTVNITPNIQITTDLSSLLFTTSNWNTPQTVIVTAVNDLVVEDTHIGSIVHTTTSADTNYNLLLVSSVTPNITDNDLGGVSITESNGTTLVMEAGISDTYSIVLTTQPAQNVTIAITPNSQLVTDISSVLFTNTNWSTPQTVTISAVDDVAQEGQHLGVITHTSTSALTSYTGLTIGSISTTINDNDGSSSNSSSSSRGGGGGGGGGVSPRSIIPPTPPLTGFEVIVNNDPSLKLITNRTVTLSFKTGTDVKNMVVSSMTADLSDASVQPYIQTFSWDICSIHNGQTILGVCPAGSYTVYVRFFTEAGTFSEIVSKTFTYEPKPSVQKNIVTSNTTTSSINSISNNTKQLQSAEILFSKDLRLGDVSSDVRVLQKFLNSNGFIIAKSGVGSPGRETNIYGKLLRATIIRFQEKYSDQILKPSGLKKGNGVFGPATRKFVNGLR